jgi:hypothetical protein
MPNLRELLTKKTLNKHVSSLLDPCAIAAEKFLDRYHSPAGYLSWRKIASIHLQNIAESNKVNAPSKGDQFQEKLDLMHQETEFLYKQPAYFLTDDLYDSLIQTDIKPDIAKNNRPNKIANSFFLITSLGPKKPSFIHVEMQEDIVFGYCNVQKNNKSYDYVFSFKWNDLTRIAFQPMREEKDGVYLNRDDDDSSTHFCCPKCTEGLSSGIGFLVINFILLLNLQPDIVSQEVIKAPTKGRGFTGPSSLEKPKQVYWVGKEFNKRIVKTTPLARAIGSNTPKTSHWRRGHWHTVSQGPGRKQKRMKWFQPTFIVGNA